MAPNPPEGVRITSPERLVLLCRRRVDGAHEYLERVRAILATAEGTGGKLATFGPSAFAIAWPADKLVSSLEIVLALREEAAAWSLSLALGELEVLDAKAPMPLYGGAPLAAADVLAAAAKPGETWLHDSILKAHGHQIRAGTVMAIAWAGREVNGALLETKPRQASSAGVLPRPSSPSVPRYRSPSTFDSEEADPEALAGRLAQLSRDALLGGDAAALEKWSDGLKATGEKDALAERMRAMARLAKGRVGDALTALREARKAAEEDGSLRKRCQAALALGVGLAFAGRNDDALLEGLDALARAREGADEQAEAACLAFLQKLFTGKHPSIFPPKPTPAP